MAEFSFGFYWRVAWNGVALLGRPRCWANQFMIAIRQDVAQKTRARTAETQHELR